MSKNHPLFKQYPLINTKTTSVGPVPTPYHVYDGFGVLIGGTANLIHARQLLRHEAFSLLETEDGRTLMAIWICNFTQASLGPHHELQFSFFADPRSSALVQTHPLSLLEFMTRPGIQMMCHGLWNNALTVVAYNRELLSLNAQLANSLVDHTDGIFTFTFEDAARCRPLLSGTLPRTGSTSFGAMWNVVSLLGFRRTWSLAMQPWANLQIVNPAGVTLAVNTVTQSYTKHDVNEIRYFDHAQDSITFGNTKYALLGFEPQFVQYMRGFKFVYLQPSRTSPPRSQAVGHQ